MYFIVCTTDYITHRFATNFLFLFFTNSVNNLLRLKCNEAESSPLVLYFVKWQVNFLNLKQDMNKM